jgi:hypothetical protein
LPIFHWPEISHKSPYNWKLGNMVSLGAEAENDWDLKNMLRRPMVAHIPPGKKKGCLHAVKKRAVKHFSTLSKRNSKPLACGTEPLTPALTDHSSSFSCCSLPRVLFLPSALHTLARSNYWLFFECVTHVHTFGPLQMSFPV